MNKFKYFAYVGAIALLSMVGFTACSSSDETASYRLHRMKVRV